VAAVRTAENERYAVLRCTIEHANPTLFSFEVEPRDSSLLQVIETCARARVPTLHLTYVARSHAGPLYQNCTLYTYTQVFFDVFLLEWNPSELVACRTSCSDTRDSSIPNGQQHHSPIINYAQKHRLIQMCV